MTNNLKIEVLVSNIPEDGSIASQFPSQEYVNQQLAKKANLSPEGRLDPSQAPDYTEIPGLYEHIEDTKDSIETTIADSLQDAKGYTNQQLSTSLQTKADLVNGKIPFDQIPFSADIEDQIQINVENITAVVDQKVAQVVEQVNGVATAANSYTDNKVAENKTYVDTTIGNVIEDVERFGVSKAVTIPTYLTPEAGVAAGTGVAAGAYFNARSTNDDTMLVEYQNVIGVATPTGKSYPSVGYVEVIAEYTALPFKEGKIYALYERVKLDNGDIVQSIIPDNTNNPNNNMTGWYNPDELQRLLNFEQVSFTTIGIIPNTSTDLTLKINQAFVTYRNLFIPNGEYVATAINIPSNTVITTQGNVTFKQKAGAPTGTRLINIVDADNVHLQPRINLIGNIATDEDEQNHGLFIRGAKHVRIGDVFGKDIRGDVVYVGGTISQPVFDVEIGGVYGDNILRNVVSHTGGVDVHYASAVCLSGAGYATFDVEPNVNSQDCDAITLGYFKGNRLLVAGLPSKPVGGVKVGFADFNKDYQTNTTPPYWAFDAIRYGALMIHNFTYVDIGHAKFENEDYLGIRITDSAGYIRGKEVRIGTLEQKNCSLNDPNYKAYNYIGLVDSFVVESGNIQLQSSDRYGFIGSNNNAEISNLKINGKLGDGFINPVYRKVEVKSDWDVYVHAGANTKPVFENCKIEFTGSVGRLTNADMSFVRDSTVQTGTFLVPSASTCKLENTTINGQYYLSGYDKPSYKTATRVGNNYYWFFNDSMYTKIGSAPTSDTDGVKNTVGRGVKVTYDPPSLDIGVQQSSIVDLAGAAVGDTVLVSFSLPLQGTQMWGEVTSANKVTVYHRNGTGSIVDLSSGTLTVKII